MRIAHLATKLECRSMAGQTVAARVRCSTFQIHLWAVGHVVVAILKLVLGRVVNVYAVLNWEFRAVGIAEVDAELHVVDRRVGIVRAEVG